MPRPEEVPALAAKARDHGFLWKITKGRHSSFLFGTIHAANMDTAFPGPVTMKSIGASDTVALELNPLKMDPASVRATLARYNQPAEPALQRRLEALENRECVNPETVKASAAIIQATAVMLSRLKRKAIYPEWAVDPLLAGIATGGKRQVVELEDLEGQLQAVYGTPQEATKMATNLVESLEKDDEAVEGIRALFDAWVASDFKALSAAMEKVNASTDPSVQAFQRRMFTERNLKMADKIEALHQQHRAFVAVGAGHMVGDEGLPSLLARRGFKVEQIQFASRPAP